MTTYHSYGVSLSEGQRKRLAKACKGLERTFSNNNQVIC